MRGGKLINLFATALLSSAAFPSWAMTGADIDLDFQNNRYYGGTPSTLLSCSRAAVGYAKNFAGALVSFPANTLRLTDLGLLIEEARTNTALVSGDLTNTTYWVTTNATVATTAAVTDPTGGTGAFLWNEGSAVTVGHNIVGGGSQSMSYVSGTIYCQSAFFKAGTKSVVQLTFGVTAVSGGVYANFDLGAGTVATTGGTGLLGSGIEAFGNGWYRCWIAAAATASVAASSNGLIGIPNTAATRSPTYTGTNGTMYVWGFQTEALPAGGGAMGPSSYVQTTTASATRPADNISATGALKTKLQSANIPGVVAKFSRSVGGIFQGAFAAGDGTVNNRNVVSINTTNQATSQGIIAATPGGAATVNAVSTAGAAVAIATRLRNGDQAVSLNNGSIATATAATYGSASVVTIGSTANTLTSMVNTYLKRLTTFAANQSNAALVTLSTP